MSVENTNDLRDKSQTAPASAVTAPHAPAGNPTGWRKWLYRLLAMTVVPAFVLASLELVLRLCGYGYHTDYYLPSEIGGQAMMIDNPEFVRRFFPPENLRSTTPTAFARAKPAGTYRIFILGESAAMGFPDSAYNFGRILQEMLRQRYPDQQFEVINAALHSITSHGILPIARECAECQPDLFVVYMGNNEVVGPYGISTVELGGFCPNLSIIRASVSAKATRTGQLVDNLMRLGIGSGPPRHAADGTPLVFVGKVLADDPRLAVIYAHFEENLQDICTAGRQAGAKVVVCTMASNLKDSAPMASVSAADLTAEQSAAWKKLYDEGVGRQTAREPAAAAACYQRALAIDDTFADVHFRLGRCLTALKKHEEAHRHYVRARDLDALRFRTDSRLNERIRATVSGREDEGIYLADAEQSFADASADGTPGEELFYEHVHLSFEGNYRLAHTVLEQLVRILPDCVRPRGEPARPFLSVQECQERLPFTEWNRKNTLAHTIVMGMGFPFTSQSDHAERLERWSRRRDEMNDRLAAGGAAAAVAAYRRALEHTQGDHYLHKDFALLLAQQGDLDGAVRHSREALKQVPHDVGVLCQLAEILAIQGKLGEAQAACAKAVRIKPDNPMGHNIMGKLLLVAGKANRAAACFEQAIKLYAYEPEFHGNLGNAWALQKQYERAGAAYNEALRLNANFLSAHHQLGKMYNNMGRFDAAEHHLQEALRIDPKQAQIHVELAIVLMTQGNAKKGIPHLQEALRLKPKWPQVEKMLQELQRQNK